MYILNFCIDTLNYHLLFLIYILKLNLVFKVKVKKMGDKVSHVLDLLSQKKKINNCTKEMSDKGIHIFSSSPTIF